MAALLHPDTLPFLDLDLDHDIPSSDLPASDTPGSGLLWSTEGPSVARPLTAGSSTATAPWNDPAFLGSLALAAPHTSGDADEQPQITPSGRPELRLIIGGLDPSVARRRSLLPPMRTVLGGFALAVLVALAAIGALRLLGADAAATVPASPAVINHPTGVDATTTSSAPVEVVVQSGDTIWSIARRLRPSGEIRGVVDALQRRVGGSSLEVGQHIDLRGVLGE